MVTLFVKPFVAVHGRPLTSNQVAENVPPPELSQPFEYRVEKPLLAAKSCATLTGFELGANGPLRLPESESCFAAASVAKSAAFWACRLTR